METERDGIRMMGPEDLVETSRLARQDGMEVTVMPGATVTAPIPPAANSAPETSKLAALQAMHQVAKQEKVVEDFVIAQGRRGATADEIHTATGLSSNSLTARLWQLSGRNRKAPQQRLVMTEEKRKTRSGRQARVYVAPIFLLGMSPS